MYSQRGGSHGAQADGDPSFGPGALGVTHPSGGFVQSRLNRAARELANIAVPSYFAHRLQQGDQQRSHGRPLSVDAASRAAAMRRSTLSSGNVSPRPVTVDSPLSPRMAHKSAWSSQSPVGSPGFAPRDLDQNPHGHSPSLPYITWNNATAAENSSESDHQVSHSAPREQAPQRLSRPRLDRFVTAQPFINLDSDDESNYSDRHMSEHYYPPPIGSTASLRPPNLQLDGHDRGVNQELHELNSVKSKRPKSSGHRLSSFFGWKRSSHGPESPTTTFSDSRSVSPGPSPESAVNPYGVHHQRPSRSILPREMLYNDEDASYSSGAASPLPHTAHELVAHVDELLHELREVSTELAASIRREMELEDEVDRYKSEMPTGPREHTRRTSDYYSDCGVSFMRLPLADSEMKIEALEKMRRKTEQEKAQLRVEMAQKTQDNLNHRKAFEMHVQYLQEQLQRRERTNYKVDEPIERQRELGASLENIRRQLHEERQLKHNVEDLLAGMREEIETDRNERNNLRDEVVPQLRSRVKGLESEIAEMQNLVYENTLLQQELLSLKNENQTVVNVRRLQLDMQQQHPRFRSIAEERDEQPPSTNGTPKIGGLSRSNSLARSKSMRNRSSSISSKELPPEPLSERIKDVEDQRDALHRTLKALILRQDQQIREHSKRVHALEMERNSALSGTPRRAAFTFEVQNLRSEVNHLRRRADDALEQKWQCEKGLSGLKMDLERAQQETGSLRDLLHEYDIFVPDRPSSSGSEPQYDVVVSDSLDKAYADLRATHADSTARMQQQESAGQELLNGFAYLEASQSRMQMIARQVQHQLASNKELRQRLGEAIGRGEREQQANAKKIMDLQGALRAAEERVVSAQGYSEEAVAKQEEHVRTMKDAVSQQSRRGLLGLLNKSPVSPKSPNPLELSGLRSPTTLGVFAIKSPRLDRTTSGKGTSVAEASRTELWEERVRDLEETAGKAEREMQEVVERMNRAQIEVAELQTERDEAMKQTRRLQREILEERERVKALAV